MTEPVPMLPTYPKVRCDQCRATYTIPPNKPNPVTGNCPKCGHDRFSTVFAGDTEAIEWKPLA